MERTREIRDLEEESENNYRKFNAAGSPEVVLGQQLAEILQEWKVNYLKERNPEKEFPKGWKTGVVNSQVIGPVDYLKEHTGLDPRRIFGMIKGEYKIIALAQAELILMVIDREYLLSNGYLRVIPNPNWSLERWMNYMNERGCI
jgi:hypothetical protein